MKPDSRTVVSEIDNELSFIHAAMEDKDKTKDYSEYTKNRKDRIKRLTDHRLPKGSTFAYEASLPRKCLVFRFGDYTVNVTPRFGSFHIDIEGGGTNDNPVRQMLVENFHASLSGGFTSNDTF